MAEAILARREGFLPDPLACTYPTVVDGLRGVQFVEAAVLSNEQGGQWVEVGG